MGPSGRAFELPVTFDTLGCCAAAACTVQRGAESFTLELETRLCADVGACDAPSRPIATCTVPPLEEGVYEVNVNGSHAFDLPVTAEPSTVADASTCATFGEPYCEPSGRSFTAAYRPDALCVVREPASEVLVARTGCWMDHWAHGPCEAVLRGTNTLELAPTRFEASCIDYPACTEREQTCLLPTLTRGTRYSVELEGREVLSFVAGESDEPCVALDTASGAML